MKIRIGFVSNSSSASFIVKLEDLNALQFEQIRNHSEVAKRFVENDPVFRELAHNEDLDCPWDIYWNETHLRGETSMTNFDMEIFLKHIGVDMSKVEFDY